MVTKSTLKLIKSLSIKKYREQHQLFIVEGYKSIQELSQTGLLCQQVLVTQTHQALEHLSQQVISDKQMSYISSLKTPPGYLAVFNYPNKRIINDSGLIVVLDGVKDPGNLGTIIRLCDWFGITQLVCSQDTVDAFNPKCVQASMASIGRVAINYLDIKHYLSSTRLPIYIADMQGESIYNTQLPQHGILVMGNESAGVSSDVKQMGNAVNIPQYGNQHHAESLNVAMATAIILGEWCRVIEM